MGLLAVMRSESDAAAVNASIEHKRSNAAFTGIKIDCNDCYLAQQQAIRWSRRGQELVET
jgi:hypothetical protein